MKAAQIKKYGNPDVIEIIETQKPKVDRGQVLIKNYASSINPFDVAVIKGFVAQMTDAKLPMVIGSDIAGVVTEVGEGVENFSVGNKVYGQGSLLAGATGAFAEFVASPADLVAKMPARQSLGAGKSKNINFNEAAAVVLTGVSAVQAIIEHFNLQSDQKILIHGGAGGIGTIAIQIAKHIGAYVAATATGEGIDYVKKLGADQVIDYKNENFENILSDFDAVFDTVGGETYAKSFKILKKGGGIVSMLMPPDQDLIKQYNVTAISQFTKITTERLTMLTNFIESGAVKIHIDKIYTLDKIKEAFSEKETGDVLGKIVIEIHHD